MGFNLFDFSDSEPQGVNVNYGFKPSPKYADTLVGQGLQSLASYSRGKPIQGPKEILGSASEKLGGLATSVKNAGYSDGSDEKRRAFVSEMLDKGYAKDAVLTAMERLDKQGAFQGGISDNPITGTLASVVSAPIQAASTLAKGESDVASGAQKAFSGDYSGAAARYGKGIAESAFGGLGLATGFTPGGAAVNTALSSETVGKPLEKYVVKPTMGAASWAQNALGFNPESEASKDVQELAGMAGPMAALGLGQKYVAPKLETLAKNAELPSLPSVSGSEKLTRKVPVATVSNELKMTPTERKTVQKIVGMDPAEYVLQKGLGAASKEELAAHFDQQAIDAFKSVNEKLSEVGTRVKSDVAKEAIADMVEQMESSPKIKRAYSNDIAYLKDLASREDYTPVELNNIRRAFDKVNTGMYTAAGKMRSGLENSVDVGIREGLSSEIEKAAQSAGFSVKEINKELRAGLAMKDAMLRSLSQDQKNNMVGLQDIGIMGVFSGGDPLTAISLGIAKKGLEGYRTKAAQKLYDLNPNAPAPLPADFGNTVPARNGSSIIAGSPSVGAVPAQLEPKTKTVDLSNLVPVPPSGKKAVPKTKTVDLTDAKPVAPKISIKEEVKKDKELNKKTVPNVSIKKEIEKNNVIIGLTDKGGIKNVLPGNQFKFNQGIGYKPVRVSLNDIDAEIVEYGSLISKSRKASSSEYAKMSERIKIAERNLESKGYSRKDALERYDEIKEKAKSVRKRDSEELLDLRKK